MFAGNGDEFGGVRSKMGQALLKELIFTYKLRLYWCMQIYWNNFDLNIF